MDSFMWAGLLFVSVFLVGRLLERIRIPWLFSALLIGAALSFSGMGKMPGWMSTLSSIGLYMMLFMIGMELNLKELEKHSGSILKATLMIELSEAALVSAFIHFMFSQPWSTSIVLALSFATVGEAILLPILDEFRITKKKIGQLILGIAALDDLIEILTFALLALVMGKAGGATSSFEALTAIAVVSFFIIRTHEARMFRFMPVESLFLLAIGILFVFLGIGRPADVAALSALVAGAVVRMVMPDSTFKAIERETRGLTYGFFGTLFFLSVGMGIDFSALGSDVLLFLGLSALSIFGKVSGSIMALRKEIGIRKALFTGIALSARFSTSIVIVAVMRNAGIISSSLYSTMIAASILFQFIVPWLISETAKRLL